MKKSEQKALIAFALIILTGGLFLIYYAFKALWNLITAPSRKKKEEQRRLYLIEKYNNTSVVNKIMNQNIWTGQSAEQLIESIGNPANIDQKVLKTKKKEIWKYDWQGGNRYGLRVTLDNDLVVGWDQKN
ncbi:MAG: hypothetical protein GC137_06895 [Alphaproteobacteria bacterium]|nr:hypothetical protein [Alphaproteobacteria bacterium]